MSAHSFFWDSQDHLSTLAFWLELGGAVVEVVVSIVIVTTFNKDWEEKRRKRIEFLFEIGFLIAAAIAVVAIVSNRRIETLRESDDKETGERIKIAESNAVAAASQTTSQTKRLADANAKIVELEAKTLQRTIAPADREKFIQLLKNAPKGRVQIQINASCGDEISTYATTIREMLAAAGYLTPPGNALVFEAPISKGVFIVVANATNQPPFAGPIQHALKAVGVEAQGAISGDRGLSEDLVRIYVGGKP
jgi:hypothetical protein